MNSLSTATESLETYLNLGWLISDYSNQVIDTLHHHLSVGAGTTGVLFDVISASETTVAPENSTIIAPERVEKSSA